MEEFERVLAEVAHPLEKMCNYLSQVNRGLRREVEVLQIENKTLKERTILIHERKVVAVERTVFMGRL